MAATGVTVVVSVGCVGRPPDGVAAAADRASDDAPTGSLLDTELARGPDAKECVIVVVDVGC